MLASRAVCLPLFVVYSRGVGSGREPVALKAGRNGDSNALTWLHGRPGQ